MENVSVREAVTIWQTLSEFRVLPQTKELSVTGGTQASETPIYPQNYSRSYFFVDTLYRQYWPALQSADVLQPSGSQDERPLSQ